MLNEHQIQIMKNKGRKMGLTVTRDDAEALGPLKLLPGTWKNPPNLEGRGWNMIALTFATESDGHLNYRLLVNKHERGLWL